MWNNANGGQCDECIYNNNISMHPLSGNCIIIFVFVYKYIIVILAHSVVFKAMLIISWLLIFQSQTCNCKRHRVICEMQICCTHLAVNR
jgi:hypothetical protein